MSESANSQASKLAKMHVMPLRELSWAGWELFGAQAPQRQAQASSIQDPSMLDRRNRTKHGGLVDSLAIASNLLRINLRREDWERGTGHAKKS